MELQRAEQRLGISQATLSTPQLGQPQRTLGRQARRVAREQLAGSLQLGLGTLPFATPRQDAGVVRAAHSHERVHPGSVAQLAQAFAPLSGATVITRLLAGEDHVAERDSDRPALSSSSPPKAAAAASSSADMPGATSPRLTSAKPSRASPRTSR